MLVHDDDENAENITNGNELDMNIERNSDEIQFGDWNSRWS